MGKVLIERIGTVKIKMDTKDDVYFDAKDAHVSFEQNGKVVFNHIMLNEVDRLCVTGMGSDMKEALKYVVRNKDKLIERYKKENGMR